LALRNDGTVIAWGWNYYGQTNVPAGLGRVDALAPGGGEAEASLAVLTGGSVAVWGGLGQFTPPGNVKNVLAAAIGSMHCVALVGSGSPLVQGSLINSSVNSNCFSVSLPTQSGRVYSLEYKTALSDATWTPLPLAAGNGGMLTLTDPTAASTARFYRVRQW